MNLITFEEAALPEIVKVYARPVGQGLCTLNLSVVERECPELLNGFRVLSKADAKDIHKYRQAVNEVGLDRVIVRW
jgi:hypothetical protein